MSIEINPLWLSRSCRHHSARGESRSVRFVSSSMICCGIVQPYALRAFRRHSPDNQPTGDEASVRHLSGEAMYTVFLRLSFDLDLSIANSAVEFQVAAIRSSVWPRSVGPSSGCLCGPSRRTQVGGRRGGLKKWWGGLPYWQKARAEHMSACLIKLPKTKKSGFLP